MENNNLYIDLHVHSNCSDGALSPTEVVIRAKDNGVSAIALADHDSVSGVAEAVEAGIELGVKVIPAVELSVQFEEWQDIHLLGYGLEYTDREFLDKLELFREYREHRNIEILDKVNERLSRNKGQTEISLTEVLAHAKDTIGRPHIARALLHRGYVTSIEDAFKSYLIPCDVPKKYWPFEEALKEIKRIGGIAVLAHPTSVSSDHQKLRRIIQQLRDLGLEGIEVYNNMAQTEDMEYLRRLAGKLNLLISGGSDFHGIEEGLEIGRGRGGIRFSDTLLAPLWKCIMKENV